MDAGRNLVSFEEFRLFAEMERLNEKMQQDQMEIDRIKLETQRLKAETRATLNRLEALI